MNTIAIKFIVGVALLVVGYYLLNKKLDLYFNGEKQTAQFEEVKFFKGGNKRRNAKRPDGHYVYYTYEIASQRYEGNFKITKQEAESKYNNYKKGDRLDIYISSKNPKNSDVSKDLHPIVILVCGVFIFAGLFLIRK